MSQYTILNIFPNGRNFFLAILQTFIAVFVVLLFYFRYGNVCYVFDSSWSSQSFLDRIVRLYSLPLIIAAVSVVSIVISFLYNQMESGHRVAFFLFTLFFTIITSVIGILFIPQDVCPGKNDVSESDHWKLSAQQAGIFLGFAAAGIILAVLMTWFVYRNYVANSSGINSNLVMNIPPYNNSFPNNYNNNNNNNPYGGNNNNNNSYGGNNFV